MSKKNRHKIGLFGIGLDTYWPQFHGLKDNLLGYQKRVNERLKSFGAEVVDAGLVDNPEVSRTVGDSFRKENVDLIFLFITTYALSSTVLPVVQRAGVPVVVLNLQPVDQLDYEAFNKLGDRGQMTGVWLEHCQACCVPEIACVFNRAGIPFRQVTGHLADEEAWAEVRDWVDAVRVKKAMRDCRVGVLGHYYCGMLDVYTDITRQAAVFGSHFELLEMCELHALREAVSGHDTEAKTAEFQKSFKVSPECEELEIERAARTSVALDRLVDAHQID
jgi:L-arabinose isomerase